MCSTIPNKPQVNVLHCIILTAIALLCSACTEEEFTATERRLFASLALSSAAPTPHSSNRYINDPQAIKLGQSLFHEPRLSGNNAVSCASCHRPDLAFSDGKPVSIGIGKTNRNSPTLLGAGWQTWFYSDGRRDSLWAQALAPLETATEMGTDRLTLAHFIADNNSYRKQYEIIFGAIPKSVVALPRGTAASPYGESSTQSNWHKLAATTQVDINRVFSNIGKAIAAFEHTLMPGISRFDQFAKLLAEGASVKDRLPLSSEEIAGARLFVDDTKTQCLQCHNGPLFSNGDFHNIGTDNGIDGLGSLFFGGRALGIEAVLLDEFNCIGNYSDSRAADCHHITFINRAAVGHFSGAFKTPTLRNLNHTAPYFHDGRFNNLQQIMAHYTAPATPPSELRPRELQAKEINQLIAFLNTLNQTEASFTPQIGAQN